MSIGNWYRVGSVAVVNGSVNVVGTSTFWLSQANPGDRFTVDGENWYEVNTIADDTHLSILSVGGSGGFAGATASNLAYAIDRNFTNNLNANIAASVASLVAQYQANSNGPLSGLFGNGAAATPGIAFLNEASTGLFHPATGIAALAVQGAEFLRAVGTASGVPAMLGVGQTAPANALDLLTTNNALYGARVVNNSTGTAARAAVQIGNGAQVLNVGINGADFTADGVLTASRGFVEGPNGVDFASGVTAGIAYSFGIGAGYTSQMTLDFQGNLAVATGSITATAGNVLVTAGKLGIGMTPAHAVDITQSQNGASLVSLLNNNAGTSAIAAVQVNNGTSAGTLQQLGNSYTTAGINRANGTSLFAGGAGGLTLATTTAQPIYFGINSAQVAEIDTSGRLGIGMTPANVLDITQSQNNPTIVSVLNATSGTTAYTKSIVQAGTTSLTSYTFSQGYTSGNQYLQASGLVEAVGSAGLGLSANSAAPIKFWINSAQVASIDASGNWIVGTPQANSSTHTITKVVSQAAGILSVTAVATSGAGQQMNVYNGAQNGGWNAANTVLGVSSDATSGRSVAVRGTVNTGGADYAEYRQLIASLYGAVAKGALLGYDATGLMTNVFASVVGRVLPKSTTPSYVGNDTWGTEAAITTAYGVAAPGDAPAVVFEPIAPTVVTQPVEPIVVPDPGDDATPNEQAAYAGYLVALAAYQAALPTYEAYLAAVAALPALQAAYTQHQSDLAAYEARVTAFNAALETERVKWDRIALCGVVPVNLTGLTTADIGKYLVPCAASDGTVTATAVAKGDLTLGQYIDSFGSIEALGSDGRPLVNVKNG